MSTKSLITQSIVARLGIEALPDAEKAELIGRIGSTIEKSVFLRVYDELSEANQDVLSEALTAGNMSAVQTLIASEGIPLERIVSEETAKITDQLTAAVNA